MDGRLKTNRLDKASESKMIISNEKKDSKIYEITMRETEWKKKGIIINFWHTSYPISMASFLALSFPFPLLRLTPP